MRALAVALVMIGALAFLFALWFFGGHPSGITLAVLIVWIWGGILLTAEVFDN